MALCFMALAAQSQETPNAQQARRVFNETYKMVMSAILPGTTMSLTIAMSGRRTP